MKFEKQSTSWQLESTSKIILEQRVNYSFFKDEPDKTSYNIEVKFYDEVARLFCQYINNPYYDDNLNNYIIKVDSLKEGRNLILNFVNNYPKNFDLNNLRFICASSGYTNDKFILNRNIIQNKWIASYKPVYTNSFETKLLYHLKGYGKTRITAILNLIENTKKEKDLNIGLLLEDLKKLKLK